MAKELLRKKGAIFNEVDVGCGPELRAEMCHKAGGRNTVPQIWIGEQAARGRLR